MIEVQLRDFEEAPDAGTRFLKPPGITQSYAVRKVIKPAHGQEEGVTMMQQLTDNTRRTCLRTAACPLGRWLLAILLGPLAGAAGHAAVSVAPAPAGEELSGDYSVTVEGTPLPVYVVKVAPADPARRWKAMDDKVHSAEFFDKAAFASFDMTGPVKIDRDLPAADHGRQNPARVFPDRPADRRQEPDACARQAAARDDRGQRQLGRACCTSLPTRRRLPSRVRTTRTWSTSARASTASTSLKVGDGKTVYLAPGAVVKGTAEGRGPVITLEGKNIVLRGRGILDGGLCPTHSRNLLLVRGKDITVEGIILRDSSTWTIPIRQSERVTVRNVKLLGYRANSDGIDICNSRDVRVEGCFIRTLDDLIVVKTDKGQGEARRIVAKDCVLWNEVAHALSVGAELRENVDDVLFSNCDVIHDKGREWTLRVFHCDSARISNVRFEDIRIEQSRRLISLWIGQVRLDPRPGAGAYPGGDVQEHPRERPFRCSVEIHGFDAAHAVEDVLFQDVVVNGKPLRAQRR